MAGSGGDSRRVRTSSGAGPGGERGPQYTVIYTVPGVTPRPGEQSGLTHLVLDDVLLLDPRAAVIVQG
jgi:hypothetical protein